MIRIVIQGAVGLKNSGDEAILQTMLQNIDEDDIVTVMTFNVKYAVKMHPGISFVKVGSKQCMEAIRECDVFILGGGGLLQDETSIYNVSRWLRYLKYCIKKGKKTYLYANSIGPIRFPINRKQVQKWLKYVDKITVRDEISKDCLHAMGIDRNVDITADPVFNIKASENVNVSRWKLSEEYAVICVRHWYDIYPLIPVSICKKLNIRDEEKYQDYIKKVAKLAEYLQQEKGMQVVFLPFLYGRDNKVAYDIKKFMSKDKSVVIEDEYLKPDEAIRIIAGSRLLVGMRLHSIIYGAVKNIPMLIISYSSKVMGMVKYLHMEKYMVEVDTMKYEDMRRLIEEIECNRTEIKEQLRKTVADAREREQCNWKKLLALKRHVEKR